MNFQNLLQNLPEVKGPTEKRLSFNIKLKWTLIVLVAFFVLANITLYGITPVAKERFKFYSLIMGTDFGSIISLGIGPIVMASIILQLLVGSKILEIDMTTEEIMNGIKTIYVNEERTWFKVRPYNGSWNPIVMETEFDKGDYSIFVYESWYGFIDSNVNDEYEFDKLTNEERNDLFEEFINQMEGWGWNVISESEKLNTFINSI